MPRIFISYRRQDSAEITGRIHDRLVRKFGDHHVFRDVYDIPAGRDFRAVLNEEVGRCDIFLAIIGPQLDISTLRQEEAVSTIHMPPALRPSGVEITRVLNYAGPIRLYQS